MMGYPGETRESLRKTRAFALSLPLDHITVSNVTPFPGSGLFESLSEADQFTREWEKMNVLEPVLVPAGLTRDDLLTARSRLIRGFYMRPAVLARHAWRAVASPRRLLHAFRALPALIHAVKQRSSHGDP
jgi:radical SAM superfamily enzyme YgiQ (UPF0313 family)